MSETIEIIEQVTLLEIVGDETEIVELVDQNTFEIVEIAEQGLPGADGNVVNVLTKIASQNLGGQRVVFQDSSTSVDYVDILDISQSLLVLGITTGAASVGANVDVQISGEMTEPSWTWIAGELVYCGANGVLTQILPIGSFLQRVGVAISPTILKVEIEEPIIL